MSRRVEIGQEYYTKFKNEILDSKVIKRIDIPVSSIEVEDLKTIKVDGTHINLSKTGVSGLATTLGISKSFVDTLKKATNDNKPVLNEIIKNIKGKKANQLTIVYNSRFNEVTNVYPEGTKLISDDQYFNALEKVISKTEGSYLRNINQNPNGDVSAIIANPNLEFQFGGLADECFTSGMSLDLSSHEMKTNFFTERLICTNGMKNTHKLCTKSVTVGDKVPDFLTSILDADYHVDSIKAFKRRLNRTYHTPASLKEVLETGNRLERILGNYNGTLTSEMSTNRLMMSFGEEYLADNFNHEFLKTDITLWELVNEITAVSSKIEQHRVAVPEGTNMAIQVIGGDLLFKKPNLAPNNIKQIF